MKPYTKARKAYIKFCNLVIEKNKLRKRLNSIGKEMTIAVNTFWDWEKANPNKKTFRQEHQEYRESLKQKRNESKTN